MGDKQDEFKMALGFAFWRPREQEYHVDAGEKMINSVLDTAGKGQLWGTKDQVRDRQVYASACRADTEPLSAKGISLPYGHNTHCPRWGFLRRLLFWRA